MKYHRILAIIFFITVSYAIILKLLTQPKLETDLPVTLEDIFGRQLNTSGLVVVDWEGYIANPAIKYEISISPEVQLPAIVSISTDNPRLMFDLPSQYGMTGASKEFHFSNYLPQSFYISIWSDRDTNDEAYILAISLSGYEESDIQIPIYVIDQDKSSPLEFEIITDFSFDTTGFFSNTADGISHQEVVQQTASDWAYFLSDMNLDSVPIGTEELWIWDIDTFYESGQVNFNRQEFTGFYLTAIGIDIPVPPYSADELWSSAAPNLTGWQSAEGIAISDENGIPLLRRSGYINIEIKGNFDFSGYYVSTDDAEWVVSGNLKNEPDDLYSVVLHEIGHALGFNSGYPRFAEILANDGFAEFTSIENYFGDIPFLDQDGHFMVIDPASRRGAFGNPYVEREGLMPHRREIITKLDLLLLEAIGYPLRLTSAFIPLTITAPGIVQGEVGEEFYLLLEAHGGTPSYYWAISCPQLPPGLKLNSFTGLISGIPSIPGIYVLEIQLDDYDLTTLPTNAVITLTITSHDSNAELTVHQCHNN